MRFESFSCHHTTRINSCSLHFSSHKLHLPTGFVVSLARYFCCLDTDLTRPRWRDLKCPHWRSRKVANHDRFSPFRAGPKCPESRLVQLQTALEVSRIISQQSAGPFKKEEISQINSYSVIIKYEKLYHSLKLYFSRSSVPQKSRLISFTHLLIYFCQYESCI